jgi:type I site-specific restriction-modification system R (restriction) subunit
MKYFDKMLFEALDKNLSGPELKNEIQRLYRLWGEENDRDKQDIISDEIRNLKTDDNEDEWNKYAMEICIENKDNAKFKEAMKKKAGRGDNLALWMIRHLVSKASS